MFCAKRAEVTNRMLTLNGNDVLHMLNLRGMKYLNIENYGKILKRFSQEELRSSNGILTQAETIIARINR